MQVFPTRGNFSPDYSISAPFQKTKARIINEILALAMALVLPDCYIGGIMGERRKAKRYDVYVPLQVCMTGQRNGDCYTAQLRDISRLGVSFQSAFSIEPGARLELTFALPTENDHTAPVLVRASAQAVRVNPIEGESTPVYGVAATIDRIDFVRPAATAHAAA